MTPLEMALEIDNLSATRALLACGARLTAPGRYARAVLRILQAMWSSPDKSVVDFSLYLSCVLCG